MSPFAAQRLGGARYAVRCAMLVAACEQSPPPALPASAPTAPVAESSAHVPAPTLDDSTQDAVAALDVISDYYAAIAQQRWHFFSAALTQTK